MIFSNLLKTLKYLNTDVGKKSYRVPVGLRGRELHGFKLWGLWFQGCTCEVMLRFICGVVVQLREV